MKKRIILLALAFLLLAVPAAWLQLQDGVMLDGQFFRQKNAQLYVAGSDSVSIARTAAGADIVIWLDDESLNAQLAVEGEHYSFLYEDGRKVEGYAGHWTDQLVDADGTPLGWMDDVVIIVDDEKPQSVLTREYALSNALYCMYEGICEQRGHMLVILMAMVIYALGVASFFWPEEVHFFGRRWRYSHAELSDGGRLVQRISGVACAIVGVVLLYAPLFW